MNEPKMVKQLSPSELSTLWLLHDRHTTRHAVEKAIELGLPLWPEAVHLARACHRSNMDLAGGAYYVVGSDFVDNEDSSQYDYHELGRYPDAYVSKSARLTSEQIRSGNGSRSARDLNTFNLLYPASRDKLLGPLSRGTDARERFEDDKNKHIQLLLGGVSTTELENFQSERASLEICEISDDETVSDRSSLDPCKTPESEEADAPSASCNAQESTDAAIPVLDNKKSEEETCLPSSKPSEKSKPKDISKEEKIRRDIASFEAQLASCCEVPSTTTIRSFAPLMGREEFERRLRAEFEAKKEQERSSQNTSSQCGDSEVENLQTSGTEIDEAVSQLAPDSEMNEVISKLMKEDVAAEFTDARTTTKFKRHYVEPFDGDSVAGSELSDTNIDVNILYEISELRREEGASSPSNYSIDSDEMTPPDVCIWHPQSWTYNIDLITYFRATSPFQEVSRVVFPREHVALTVQAPKFEEVNKDFEFARKFPHCAAFTRRKGARYVQNSLTVPATRTENINSNMNIVADILEDEDGVICDLVMEDEDSITLTCRETVTRYTFADCAFTDQNWEHGFCLVEHVGSQRLRVFLETKAAKVENCFLDCNVPNNKLENFNCSEVREDRCSYTTSLKTKASTVENCAVQCEAVDVKIVTESCHLKLADRVVENIALSVKAPTHTAIVKEVSLESDPLCESSLTSVRDCLQEVASISCREPENRRLDVPWEVAKNKYSTATSETILPAVSSERVALTSSVPSLREVKQYFKFFVDEVGNSTKSTWIDKNLRTARYHCRAHSAHETRRSRANATTTRKRADSLHEVLRLLESGAMPSQYIEASPPRPLLSRISTTATQFQGLRELKGSETWEAAALQQSDVSDSTKVASDLNTQLEVPTIPRSECSGLSDSPDRLVICDDEDLVVKEPLGIVEDVHVPSSAADILPESLVPLPETTSVPLVETTLVPPLVETTLAPLLAEAESRPETVPEPVKRSIRKKSVTSSATVTTRKRSVKEQNAEVVHTTPERGRKLEHLVKSEKRVSEIHKKPATSAPKPVRRNKSVIHESSSLALEKPSTSLDATPTSVRKASQARHAKVKEVKLHKLEIAPTTMSLPCTSSSAELSTSKPKTTKKRSPIIKSQKSVFTTVLSTPTRKLGVEIRFPLKIAEKVSFACCAPLLRDPRRLELFTDTGLDLLAEVAVSAASPLSLKNLEVSHKEPQSTLELQKEQRKERVVPEIIPFEFETPLEPEAIEEEFIIYDEVQPDGSSLLPEKNLTVGKGRKSARTPSTDATRTERKRKINAVPDIEPAETPKRRRTRPVVERAHTSPVIKGGAKTAASRTRGKRKPATPVEDLNDLVISVEEPPRPLEIREVHEDVQPRKSKRRKTGEPVTSQLAAVDVEKTTLRRRRTIAAEKPSSRKGRASDTSVVLKNILDVTSTLKRSTLAASSNSGTSTSLPQSEPRLLNTAKSPSAEAPSGEGDIIFVKSGLSRRRSRSPTPPILVVDDEITASFVPIKLDNNRSAETTLPDCNREDVSSRFSSSDIAEMLDALALDIIIGEASALSAVNLATFAQFVLNLFDPVMPYFAPLEDIEPSTLPANFTTIFELATPLQYRHRLDYNSFNSMLLNRLPENGLLALTLDSHHVSMLKITKFVDTVKEAVVEICEELRNRRTLSKAEIKKEIDLSGEVQVIITSRYVETMMKMADVCGQARDVPLPVIADRFHLLLCGWQCFLQQGGVLRVRLQLCPGRSHPAIVDITTAWLDKIDTILSRAQATKSMRTSAFAVSLAQEKTIVSKVWHQMASHTSASCEDGSFIYCEECKLYFRNEDTDFIHKRVFHQKSRECEECYDMFHTLLGLDLHMVGSHKRNFAADL
ncbi:unnamed protein product [Cylicocyclus nassatus]|uniref:C2H2-type domain-containing protein n=1 Tax=Cylicocyclus nassatus TaxID=53992 RepID=A0AA36GEF9_CYLNA|nr:unnamed protein product [Cylicocyclus nassatus]